MPRPAVRCTVDTLDTELGPLTLACDETGALRALLWDAPEIAGTRARDPFGVTSALRAYFRGELRGLSGLRVGARGTPFQEQVWRALREIPPGETSSYGALAARIGRPGAARAVGMANHVNPVAIVVPCHRVIGADGALTGYAAGLERKRFLLEHERRWAARARRAAS